MADLRNWYEKRLNSIRIPIVNHAPVVDTQVPEEVQTSTETQIPEETQAPEEALILEEIQDSGDSVVPESLVPPVVLPQISVPDVIETTSDTVSIIIEEQVETTSIVETTADTDVLKDNSTPTKKRRNTKRVSQEEDTQTT